MKTTRFSTTDEVAATLRVSKRTVLRMVAAGELPAIKFGQTVRVPTQEVWNFIASHVVVPGMQHALALEPTDEVI